MASKLWLRFQARRRVLVDIYGRWRSVVIGIVTAYGILGFVKGEFLPNLPITPLLPTWIWVLIIMGVLLILTVEGSYRLVRKAKDNYVDNYKYEKGRLPPLPPELEELFDNYQSGEPISQEMKPKTPSLQCWNFKLSPTNRKVWRDVIIWLGRNPDDILWHMEKMRLKASPANYLRPKRKSE